MPRTDVIEREGITVVDIDRRRFLKLTGAASAAGLAHSLLGSVQRAAAIAPQGSTGTIMDVEHVVILMQENRSFDHYLASLRGVRGFGDPHPVQLPSGKSVWHQADSKGEVLPFHPQVDDLGAAFLQGLDHAWPGGQKAVNNGHYDQWIPAKTPTTMAYLLRQDAAFHYALADAFTICDAYYCSFIGNTDPNRYYLWTGWTGNDGKGGGPVLYNDELGYDWPTYPERLEAAGISWKIYQDIGSGLNAAGSWGWDNDAYIGNYGDTSLLYFNSYRNAQPGDPLYEKARTGTENRKGQDYFEILAADVKADRLPQVSWISAPEAFTEHSNWPTNYGAWYISKVLDTLTSNPEVWAKTALFITYDENDGFFDHLVPPHPNTPIVPGASTVSTEHEFYPGSSRAKPGPYGMGPRVPMFVISPWSTGGYVCSETFDHTSVIRFLEQRFGIAEPQITPWRRTVAGDLTSAFDFSRSVTGLAALPDTSAMKPQDRLRHKTYYPPRPASTKMPTQEPGTRPARPLGYNLNVVEKPSNPLDLTIVNDGSLGAHLQARLITPARQPHSYTVGAGHQLDTQLPVSGAYEVHLHGPNGFFRKLAGDTRTDRVAVTLRPLGDSGKLRVEINAPHDATEVTVTDVYAGPVRIHGNGKYADLDTRDAGGWYDITVTAGSFVRVFAGHLENGSASISDPSLG
ncbi:phosphocholine-specific phospholipase C [Micromonospora fulviviridis]|uniref:phosphocholine-specific phospholipase C n=1 Tax=Micromonospora fulviviridis TaxID=47860 RepID=UPI0037B65942